MGALDRDNDLYKEEKGAICAFFVSSLSSTYLRHLIDTPPDL